MQIGRSGTGIKRLRMNCKGPMSALSEKELVVRAQQGCEPSFAELVARFQVPILRYLQRRTSSPEDAEDIAQEVFVRAYQKLGRYNRNFPFRSWLFTIAHRLSINHYRRFVRLHRPLFINQTVTPDPAETLEFRENRKRLWDLAAVSLTESQWTSLWMFYVEEMSINEIGKMLSCSPAAAKALLHRARRKLASEWKGKEAAGFFQQMSAILALYLHLV